MTDPQDLGQIRFFELLDHEDRFDLAKLVDDLPLAQGALFETGDRGEELYIVWKRSFSRSSY